MDALHGVRVHVHRDRERGVTQRLGNHLGSLVRLQQQRCKSVLTRVEGQ